ncbi:MAG: hypothetical protein A2156_02660 [Deltaproteobacteria bacterium RBG_16_48_10]|nr:MAG: hypothetical protein A2156_02660 [Deltaproteobacteria bacterium RBG_16_48_10]
MIKRSIVKYWAPVILWMGFIFWMSTGTFSAENTSPWVETVLRFLDPEISSQDVSLTHGWVRKAGHVMEYFILGLLLFRAFRGGSTTSWKWRWSIFAVIVVFLWATSDELHQSSLPTRTASVIDAGIDSAGGVLAQFVSALWYRYKKK